jgi:hypothetical protein
MGHDPHGAFWNYSNNFRVLEIDRKSNFWCPHSDDSRQNSWYCNNWYLCITMRITIWLVCQQSIACRSIIH